MPEKRQRWSGRFQEAVDPLVKEFTASVLFDKRLALVDIEGSLAHATMLAAHGIISADDLAAIERGMAQIARRDRGRRASSGSSTSKTCT